MKKVDVAIIGAGIIGSAISYQLAKYNLDILILEKNPIIADETTAGNPGIIHGGFDVPSDKSFARLNVLGNKLWQEKIFPILDFPRLKLDSLVIAFNDQEKLELNQLYKRGLANGVKAEHLQILDKEALLKREPNLNKEVQGALLCTNSWIINPPAAANAFVNFAKENGAQLIVDAEVVVIKYDFEQFELTLNTGEKILAKNVINAAGHYADTMAHLAGYPDFNQTARRGEYRVLGRSVRGIVKSICFMVSTINRKEVVVSPMLDGRTIEGPTAVEDVPKQDTQMITKDQSENIALIGRKLFPDLNTKRTELAFSSSRPISVETDDFVIQYAKGNKHFINVAGMQSPGLSAAPAIAMEVVDLLAKNGTKLTKK